ncbi:MAG: gephyrin-like molybdotransferase Glp [Phaeobacter gallaeciensis]
MTILEKIEQPGCGCDAPERLKALLSIDHAFRRISQHTCPVEGTETISLARAQGRILADPVRAQAMTPPFDNAAMDGYAVDSAALVGEGPWMFRVAGRVPAGQTAKRGISGDAAARIFTGAPVPVGADAVVMQEDVRHCGDSIRIDRRPVSGMNIRRAGDDMRTGDIILAAGQRLGPREVAACAAAGSAKVRVRRPVRVALLVTGDEVHQTGSARAAAGIWDVNTPMLTAMLSRPDVDLLHIRTGADDRSGLQRQLEELSTEVDLVVTTGGISVGEEDHVKPALNALGAEFLFSGVAMKPGKPVSFGRIGCAQWLGLPGNPLAAFVTWQLFGTAVLRTLSGTTGGSAARRNVVLGQGIRRKPGRCELRPAWIAGFDGEGREVVQFEEATHSARVARLPAADGLMLLPAEADQLSEGALVEFQPFCDM